MYEDDGVCDHRECGRIATWDVTAITVGDVLEYAMCQAHRLESMPNEALELHVVKRMVPHG